MCVKDLVLELESIMSKIEKKNEELKSEKSRIDSIRNDLLHFIENDTFNASQGYKYAKALQKIQNERRVIGYKLRAIQALKSKLRPLQGSIKEATRCTIKNINKFENLTELGTNSYNPRILKSASKDDILNQVVYILSEEE